MMWEQWFCSNGCEDGGGWLVQQDQRQHDLWLIARSADSRPWPVAASVPVCPRCGTTLCAAIELERGAGRTSILEAGPIQTFVESLA